MIRMVGMVLMMAYLLMAYGCGGVLKNLDRTNELTAGLTKSMRPLMKAAAKEAQDACFADAKKVGKLPKSIKDCPAHKKVWDFRRRYYDTANGIHIGVRVGAIAYKMKDEKGATTIAIKAGLGLVKLKDMVIRAGYLKAIGL